ncbi:MAG: hypothetical protein ACO3UU_15145 [Minisyncoccia bacterium]
MSSYKITKYSKQQADKLGVQIKTSTNPSKKIDVYKNGDKIASIGSSSHNDFPTWIEKKGKTYANERRRLYKARNQKDRNKVGTASFYASRILW